MLMMLKALSVGSGAMADAQYTLETPEHVTFHYEIAGIGSRFLAALLDSFLIVTVQAGLLFLSWEVLLLSTAFGLRGLEDFILALWVVMSFLFFWGYYIFFELASNGQTPGKQALHIRVVHQGGKPVNVLSSVIRNLVRVIDFLPFCYGVGLLVMFVDHRARRLGDYAAGTLVVKERQAVSLESLTHHAERVAVSPGRASLSSSPFTPSIPHLERITPVDYHLIQDFLRRRGELEKESRERLAKELAQRIGATLGLLVPPGDHHRFLEQVAYEYRAMRQGHIG